MTSVHILGGLDNGLASLYDNQLTHLRGTIYTIDLSGPTPEDLWKTWVSAPSTELMLETGERVRTGNTDTILLIIKTVHEDADGEVAAYRDAAIEALRGTAGSIALERAPQRALTNIVIVDQTTTEHDLVHAARYLLDPQYNGFTTGATLHLTAQTAESGTRTPGKVLITGGAGTIGFATAQAYKAAGYEPILADLFQDRLDARAQELGGAETIVLDVTDADAIRSAASDQKLADLAAVALVHGYQGSYELQDLTPELIASSIDVNGTSVANTITAFAPILSKAKGSFSIVSSQCGIRAEAVTAAYCAPKFGIVGLARGLAPVLAKRGVSINTLCPGPVDTPFLRAYFERFAAAEGGDIDAIVAERSASMPLGRFAQPAEMGNALRFLSELDATGVLLAPTGGETLT